MNAKTPPQPPTPDPHISLDELSDAAEQLLTADDATRVERHVQSCAACAALAGTLTELCTTLSSEPTPPMPDAVFERLSAVVRAESARRDSGTARAEDEARSAARAKRTVGTFGDHPDFDRSWSTPDSPIRQHSSAGIDESG